MLKIYHNPRCSKSRCALDILKTSGKDFEVIDYLKNVPDQATLKIILKKLNLPAIELVRKGESVWKEKFRDLTMDDDQIIDAMVQFPQLIERPVVVEGDQAVIARPPERVNELL
jgi:arsenate reductase